MFGLPGAARDRRGAADGAPELPHVVPPERLGRISAHGRTHSCRGQCWEYAAGNLYVLESLS